MAILGGGAAGVAAAYELTRTAELRDAFEVTLYQQGWRLGGKGASGRDADRHDRIEEHGLHIWFGFYRNAFGLLDRCYRELADHGRAARFEDCADAFLPCSQLTLTEPAGEAWRTRSFSLPAGMAGDGRHPLLWFPPYLLSVIEAIAADLLRRAPEEELEPRVATARAGLGAAAAKGEGVATGAPAPGPRRTAAGRLGARGSQVPPAAGLLGVARRCRALARDFAAAADDSREAEDPLRFLACLVDFAKAVTAVLALCVVPRLGGDPAPFDRLNAIDFRELLSGEARDGGRLGGPPALRRELWLLRRLGLLADAETLDASFVRVLYDLAFAYRGGDPARPDVGAGVALENLLNIGLGHGGALMHKMRAGMGDIVFGPLYRALAEPAPGEAEPRVRFEFFSAVERVDAPAGRVGAVSIVRQARLADPSAGYRPLRDVHGLPCWPSAPDLAQLDRGSRAAFERMRDELGGDHPATAFERELDPLGPFTATDRVELRVGRDFDEVVLAIPVGAHAEVAGAGDGDASGGIDDEAFRAMVAAASPVATNAFQAWLVDDYETLGRPPGLEPHGGSILGGYRKPFDTYCDMTHLLAEESWPERERLRRATVPRHLAYFCGPMADPPADWRAADRAAGERALEFLRALEAEGGGRPFWQRRFGPDELVAGRRQKGWERFGAQYWRANSTGWERYATSHAGTLGARLRADGRRPDGGAGMRVGNLALAGDWTYTAVNAGSVEAAVSSGIEAARALIRRANADGARLPEPAIHLPPWRWEP